MNQGKSREQNLKLDTYFSDHYFTDVQWLSMLEQINLVRKYKNNEGTKILEVGKGSGIVETILKHIGYDVTTFDINPNLNPTKVADITSMEDINFGTRYDLVLCAEVLEHIPFGMFDRCLQNLRNLSKDIVIITLPNCKEFTTLSLKYRDKIYKKTFFGKASAIKCKAHFWELNSSKATETDNIIHKLNKYYKIVNHGTVQSNPNHYYFVCKIR